MHCTTLFIWFILYSILGWMYETIYCSLKSLKWDNRGMLIGPYCPIYGVGAVLDVLLCGGLPGKGAVFLACMLGSAVIQAIRKILLCIFNKGTVFFRNLQIDCISCRFQFRI